MRSGNLESNDLDSSRPMSIICFLATYWGKNSQWLWFGIHETRLDFYFNSMTWQVLLFTLENLFFLYRACHQFGNRINDGYHYAPSHRQGRRPTRLASVTSWIQGLSLWWTCEKKKKKATFKICRSMMWDIYKVYLICQMQGSQGIWTMKLS